MSAPYTRQDRVLSVRERERFQNEIRDRERAMQGQIVVPRINGAEGEGMSARRAGRWNNFIDQNIHEDKAMLNHQICHLRKNLDAGSPRDLSRKERIALEKQIKEDAEYFRKNMVPSNVYYKKSNDPGFDKATEAVYQKEVANSEFQRRANRYKNNIREIDSENPNASNIEKFRPKR